ncbi:MAG: lactate utilization protein [Planctomycetaceae bacterium]|nr:lactate utilization protein [Planctomycetaceae bacterium]
MSSRDLILSRIRTALNAHPGPSELPPTPQVWPAQQKTVDEMAKIFQESITLVAGEVVFCPSWEEAAHQVEARLKTSNAKKIGVAKRPVVEQLLQKSPALTVLGRDCELVTAPAKPDDVSGSEMAELDASLVGAEFLLADTGSCVVPSSAAFDRMLCYLSPVCFVIATKSMLREHLPAVWPEISARLTAPVDPALPVQKHGEFLIVTGPSRTADIEKILILGVHGPKQLIVFLIDDQS